MTNRHEWEIIAITLDTGSERFKSFAESNDHLQYRVFQAINGKDISEEERGRIVKLPCVGASFTEETDALYKNKVDEIVSSSEGLGIASTDLLIQSGNWIFPSVSEDEDILSRVRQDGFDNTFEREKRGSVVQFRAKEEIGIEWLLEENLPSCHFGRFSSNFRNCTKLDKLKLCKL
jgi:hypothetical protein